MMVISSDVQPDLSRLATYRAARDLGTRWFLDRLHSDGSMGTAQPFEMSRAPWTFSVVGETHAAASTCEYFRRESLRPDRWMSTFEQAYAYRRSQVVIGAQLAGRYDIARALLDDLIAWRDPKSGAFPNSQLPDGSPSDNMDIPFTCGVGFAFLVTGQLEHARAIAAYLRHIYDAQDELPDRFFYALSRTTNMPIRSYPESERRWYIVENQDPRDQRWTVGGIAAGFLCRLYLAEPREEYIELARKYQAFSMSATDRQFDHAAACKSSWGSSLLYQVTGESEYLDWTTRMGDWYLTTQHADGHWSFDRTTEGRLIDLTLEFVMHLDTIIGCLSARASSMSSD
jgi:hypothetical protein